jgi:hypothetical protein
VPLRRSRVEKMSKKARVFTYLSSVPAMLEKAQSLIALTELHPDSKATLAACATLVLAAALDQGTLTFLDHAAAFHGYLDGKAATTTKFAELANDSLRNRFSRLPELMTKGKLALDRRNPQVRLLHELITARNDLMHIYEEPREAEVTLDDATPISRDDFMASGPREITITLPRPVLSRWFSTTVEQARAYSAALEAYTQEVLFPASGDIRAGKLVIPEARHRRAK